jgi:hypothetical protein
MPPKRSTTTRPSGAAKRGRANAGGRSKNVKEHVRVLSDISEELTAQRPTAKDTEPSQRITRSSKKRSFQDFADDGDEREPTQPAKQRKQKDDSAPGNAIIQQSQTEDQDQIVHQEIHQQIYQNAPTSNTSPLSPPYSPSINLLFFVQLASLDTDDDTEWLTLNLIKLTLADMNWHPGLSGMVQPVACFLVASILTRRQNLVEDVASSIETFGVGFDELVEGYALLWEWRENMRDVVGAYAQRLEDLPEPSLMIAQQDHYDQVETDMYEQEGDEDDRPEPERWNEVIQV